MTFPDYCSVLGVGSDPSTAEKTKAYRNKARLYHPDLNSDPSAKEKFIQVTEAYEFLLAHHGKIQSSEEELREALENWRKYRQYRTRRRADAYARTSFRKFENSRYYRTTRVFDGTTIIFSLAISILVITYTIVGYIYRVKHPLPKGEQPSVVTFILLLVMGLFFLTISLVYLSVFRKASKKKNQNKK